MSFVTIAFNASIEVKQKIVIINKAWSVSALIDALNEGTVSTTTEKNDMRQYIDDSEDNHIAEIISSTVEGEYNDFDAVIE